MTLSKKTKKLIKIRKYALERRMGMTIEEYHEKLRKGETKKIEDKIEDAIQNWL